MQNCGPKRLSTTLYPSVVEFSLQKWKPIRQNILCINFFDGAITLSGQSSLYIKKAGIWLRSNIPVSSSIYSNNPKIYYYSDRLSDYRKYRPRRIKISKKFLSQVKIKNKDYFVLWSSRKAHLTIDEVSKIVGTQPIKIFSNKRDDKILIYKNCRPQR